MAEIVDTLIEARTALLAGDDTAVAVENIFKGGSEMEIELNGYLSSTEREYTSLEKIEKILRGETGIAVIDRTVLRIPRARYFGSELPRIKELTRAVTGCENEEELFEIIANETDENSAKMKSLYRNMSRWLTENSSTILKTAIYAGLGVGFLAYLKSIQKEETGCFRYDVKGNREKIPRRSCSGNTTDDDDGNIIAHPLDGISWDCNYDITPLESFDAGRTLKKGCKGICDPRAYNALRRYAPPYRWRAWTPDKNNKYHYVCEKGTVIRALAREVGTDVNEIMKGFNDAHLFDSFKRVILPILLILILTYINCSFVMSCASLGKK